MDKLIKYTSNRNDILSTLPEKPKFQPVPFHALNKRKRYECFLCDYHSDIHKNIYHMFKSQYNLKSNDDALWKGMVDLYQDHLKNCKVYEPDVKYPQMDPDDFKIHFLEHILDGKVELSQQLKKLRVLEKILLESCILKDAIIVHKNSGGT